MRLLLTLITMSLFLGGCAGVFHGTSQSVTFNSNPEGAEVLIDGVSRGVTPLTVKLKKNEYDVAIVKKEGYRTVTFQLDKKYDGIALLNIIWDSSTTDLITGAAYQYEPNSFYANLVKAEPEVAPKK